MPWRGAGSWTASRIRQNVAAEMTWPTAASAKATNVPAEVIRTPAMAGPTTVSTAGGSMWRLI
jgi:hypothetical protein